MSAKFYILFPINSRKGQNWGFPAPNVVFLDKNIFRQKQQHFRQVKN